VRVLFWLEKFWPSIGGVQIFSAKLLPALRARGYEFTVMTGQHSPDLPTEAQYKEMPVYRFPFLTALIDRNVDQILAVRQQVAKLKRTFAPDLVHIHGVGPSVFFCLETTHVYTAPLLVTLTIEEQPEQAIGHELWRHTLHAAAWVTGPATAVLAQARQLVPEITPRSSVIHYGLDVPSLLSEPLPFETPRLLCLGRLTAQKGFDLALTALASILDRFPNIRLIVAGDGPERSALERQVSELGLSNVVDFTGWIAPDGVLTLINTATIVVMPSRWEGLPSVALQAGLMARPIVAARVAGLSEVVMHQQTGLLIEKDDSGGLAQAIAFLLEHPEMATQMGQAARQRAQEVFSWEQYVNAYDALYQRLIEEGRSVGLPNRTSPLPRR
jgi:glycogen synthase